MRSNEEMSALARAFADAYLEEYEEGNPGRREALESQFHGIPSIAEGFIGALIDSYYHEPPWTRFVFFVGLALRSISLGSMGLIPRVWTREELVSGWNVCQKVLVNANDFFKTESESEASS